MRKVEAIHKNSLGNHDLNRISREVAEWSRSNSFSLSSNDSTVFCSSELKQPGFTSTKRLAGDQKSGSKRNRNYSGSSSSSNFSSISDKEIKTTPLLISTQTVKNTKLQTVKKLTNISSTALTFQRETLMNNTLSESIDNSVLPFHHNLRKNIRKKTCTCECTTSSCTTFVRQLKESNQRTIEEKTVISRTKVKTYVDQKSSRQFSSNEIEKATFSSNCFESSSNRTEPNRKRRSEIEKLYDSLHEIKWAKNFSPDNILRQLDVRQAASCSLFGKSNGNKSTEKTKSPNKQKVISNELSSPKSLRNNKVNKSYPNRLCSSSCYSTRNKSQNIQNDCLSENTKKKSSMQKNNSYTNGHIIRNPFPLQSRITTGKDNADTLNKALSINSYNSIHSCLSSIKNNDNFSKKFLSFDLNPEPIENFGNVNDCTFFDIAAEEGIRTIDACFGEVGAEVVVSTCYESDFKLPLLTSAEENCLEGSSVSNENPPILEASCEESGKIEKQHDAAIHKSDNFFREVKADVVLSNCCKRDPDLPLLTSVKEINLKDSSIPSVTPPTLEPHLFEMSPGADEPSVVNSSDKSSFDICETFESHDSLHNPIKSDSHKFNSASSLNQCRDGEKYVDQNRKELERAPKSNLHSMESINNMNFKRQTFDLNQKLSILKHSLNIIGTNTLMSETKNNTMLNSKKKKINFLKKENNSYLKLNCYKSQKDFKNHIFKKYKSNAAQTKSIIFRCAKQILKKYLNFFNCKHKNLSKPLLLSKNFHICEVPDKKKLFSSKLNYSKQNILNQHLYLPTVISTQKSFTHISCTNSSSKNSPIDSASKLMDSTLKNVFSPPENHGQAQETIANSDNATVIQTFNQKWLLTESPNRVTINHFSNSFYFHSEQESKKLISKKKTVKKSSITDSQALESAPVSGYMKILDDSKKLQERSVETVKVPSRVFTCHYQTLNVTRGSNYIQIVLKITRRKAVFLTQESLLELKEAIDKAGRDNDCKLLILNGFGQTFCLGIDLVPIVGSHKNQVVGEVAMSVKNLISTLADFHKPIVAIVNGAAYGLGMTLLNHADVTLATTNASFCMPYSKLGYMPEGGATLTLPQTVGATVAMDLMLRGQVITAQQAKQIGLVNEVVELHDLPQELVKRVKTIAENSISGMETTKAMIKMRLHIQLPLVLEAETKLLPQMWLSPTCQEAIKNALSSGFLANY